MDIIYHNLCITSYKPQFIGDVNNVDSGHGDDGDDDDNGNDDDDDNDYVVNIHYFLARCFCALVVMIHVTRNICFTESYRVAKS